MMSRADLNWQGIRYHGAARGLAVIEVGTRMGMTPYHSRLWTELLRLYRMGG
jgi:hypothetical protein